MFPKNKDKTHYYHYENGKLPPIYLTWRFLQNYTCCLVSVWICFPEYTHTFISHKWIQMPQAGDICAGTALNITAFSCMPASLLDATAASETSVSCHSPRPATDPLPGCRWLLRIQETPFLIRKNIVFFIFTDEKEQHKQMENKRTSRGKWEFCFIFVQVKNRPQIL